MTPDYAGLARALLPEAALVAGALLVLGCDLIFQRGSRPAARLRLAAAVAAAAVLVALLLTLWVGPVGEVFGGVLVLDSLAVATRVSVLGLTLLVLGISLGGRVPRPPAEYVAVLLFATCGFLVMAAAQQLLLAFLALELASLALYVLAGFDAASADAAEAAVKYFLLGAMSAAFLLFGFSLLYGLTHTIELAKMAVALVGLPPSPLLSVALVMVLVGFGFKVAAAPFHLWAPDAYQGAPAPSAALIASASKLAGFVLFTRLLWPGLGAVAGGFGAGSGGGWIPLVVVLAGASLLIGNLAALVQTDLRRLLAYSAIAHTGALLLGVIASGSSGPAPLFYYAATYGLATVGALGVIAVVEAGGGRCTLTDLAGLSRRSPLLAACLLIFILSLAGIPPLAGFFGKFAVFAAAFKMAGLAGPAGWLAILAIALSAVALYYYLKVLKQAWVVAPPAEAGALPVPPIAAGTLVVTAALTLVLGLWPSLLLSWL